MLRGAIIIWSEVGTTVGEPELNQFRQSLYGHEPSLVINTHLEIMQFLLDFPIHLGMCTLKF